MRRSRLQRTATIVSQLLNVWIFDGMEDETISGRAWREGVLGGDPIWARRRKIIDKLFLVITFGRDVDHCRKSHEVDLINVAPFCALLKG